MHGMIAYNMELAEIWILDIGVAHSRRSYEQPKSRENHSMTAQLTRQIWPYNRTGFKESFSKH